MSVAVSFIPVKLNGVDVGSARIHYDGKIELVMSTPSQPGMDLIKLVKGGLVDELALNAIPKRNVIPIRFS